MSANLNLLVSSAAHLGAIVPINRMVSAAAERIAELILLAIDADIDRSAGARQRQRGHNAGDTIQPSGMDRQLPGGAAV